jgi:RHS repeat-associated protein
MLSDGSNTFTWNARNQVATLNSVSLQYDAFGRRTRNLLNTSFVYDGANAAQELSGNTVLANLISGGIDEIFTRADSTGTFTPLKDALGSTVALIDASGNVVTTYSYDPFGNTTVSGAANANEFQYNGRENEGNGLYFYRARYYNSTLGRFINEDPIGFGGGDINVYAYVSDDPVNFVDPSGMDALSSAATAARAALTLLRGGGGAAPISGTVAETGSVGGPLAVGFAAEGLVAWAEVDWFIALHGEQAAYDEEWHANVLANQAVMTRAKQPGAQVLAGRYSAQRKQAEHDAYKEFCQSKVPAGADPCATLSKEIDHANRCMAMMQAWDAKWPDPKWPLGRHANDINGLKNRLQNLKDEHNDKCVQ